jgi:predicted AlkP superfamily pyrophosphatase or phosphodiesterase
MIKYLLASFIAFAGAGAVAQLSDVQHVVVIGCDGMSPDGVRNAKAPVMRRMMAEGAWTLKARGVMPTSSSANWASMLTGVGPEQHGITSNDWHTNRFEIQPIERGPQGTFPTVFSTLRDQRPSVVLGCFHDWNDFGRLLERPALNVLEDCDGPTNAALHSIAFIVARKPALTFIHFDNVDHAGHRFGHGTAAYYHAVDVADKLIGQVLKALEDSKMMDQTIVLISSDHGGVGTKHGNPTMAELEIPWIIYGRGVKRGYEIQTPVNTYDTAITIAYILGVTPHSYTIGKAIKEAFL